MIGISLCHLSICFGTSSLETEQWKARLRVQNFSFFCFFCFMKNQENKGIHFVFLGLLFHWLRWEVECILFRTCFTNWKKYSFLQILFIFSQSSYSCFLFPFSSNGKNTGVAPQFNRRNLTIQEKSFCRVQNGSSRA